MTEPVQNEEKRTETEETVVPKAEDREKERGKSEEKKAETAGAKAARKEEQAKRKAAKPVQPKPTDPEEAETAGDGGEVVKIVAESSSPKVETTDPGFERETAKVKAAVASGENVQVEAPEAGKSLNG